LFNSSEARDMRETSHTMEDKNQVLIVDDDQRICELVSRMLERLGHKSVSVSSGASAVDACKQGDYDLVLLDVAMPNMSGPQVYDTLRGTGADLPVVFMTGYRTEELANSLQDDTAVGFLAKPFPLEELRAMLDSLLTA